MTGDPLAAFDAFLEVADNQQARKVATLLRALETYVVGQAELIIDYAAARHRGEPIPTVTTERTAQRLLHRRMDVNQQMRCPRVAHTPDAEGSHRGDEWDVRCGSRRRRTIRPPPFPAHGVRPPKTVLLIDEPTEGLAPMIVDEIFAIIGDLKRAGLTILLVEQNIHRTLDIADRFYAVERGRVTLEGEAASPKDRARLMESVSV